MSLDLEAIKARADAATAGPWRVVCDDSERQATVMRQCESPNHPLAEDPGRDYEYDCCLDGELHSEPFFREKDAEFIAHAREDIPALLAEVERLRATEARVRELAEKLTGPQGVQWAGRAIQRALDGGVS